MTNPNTTTAWGALVGYIIAFLIVALIAMLAWNLGIVPLVAAMGGTVTEIGYFTALFSFVAFKLLTAPLVGLCK